MRAEGPNHYPYILGMALNQYRIDTHDCMEIFHENGYRALNQYIALLPQTQFKNIFK